MQQQGTVQNRPDDAEWRQKKQSFSINHFNNLSSQQEKCQYLGEIFWP